MKIILSIALLFICLVSQGQNQNISNGIVFDGEPYVATNPNNSQHIVVAWMGWIDFSNRFKIKVKTSFNGGQTWSAAAELPHTVVGYSSADPSIDFDPNGDPYVCYIDFTGTTPPVTGGVYITKSTDGGLSWNAPIEVINTNYDGTKWPIDRPWMVIDKSSSSNQGNIYVSSMNLNRTNAPFNPYLSVSTDGGATFSTSYLDAPGWLAGSINQLPMCSPTVSSSGIFYGSYPSYELSQSFYVQSFLAISSNGGSSFNHQNIITFNPPTNTGDYPLAKKAGKLLSNPANPDHLASLFLSAVHGDLDLFLIESFDAGVTWTTATRVNDDPIGNNRMQDLIWGDFDIDGDLIVGWRDRRNANDSTFGTQTEIWASYRSKDSLLFSPNFQLTSETVAYDSILESAGNDFMSIKILNDTINAAWGDTRNGKLNIWYQRMTVDGTVLSVQQIASEAIPTVFIYPNPTVSELIIESEQLENVKVYDPKGSLILSQDNQPNACKMKIDVGNCPASTYIIEVTTKKQTVRHKIEKH